VADETREPPYLDEEPASDPGPEPVPTRAEVDAKLEKQPWGTIRAELVLYGLKRRRSPPEAQDLAQEAMLRVWDPHWRPWNFRKQPSLWKHMVGIVNRLITNRWKAAETKAYGGPIDKHAKKMGDPQANPEQVLLAREEEAQWAGRLVAVRALLEQKEDKLGLQVLDLFEGGVAEAADQAARLYRPVKEIYKARERLAAAGQAVLDAEKGKLRS
jgi:hypothetical protein